MADYALRYRSRISRRSAHDMIMMLAMHSNHNQPDRFRAEADVKRAFERNGVDYARLVEQCRDWPEPVPFSENLLGSTWTAGPGVTASRVDQISGQDDCQVEGPGTLTLLGYWATFESAHRSLTKAVELASYPELQSAIVDGIASIEGYVGHRAEIWNRQQPDDQLVDTKLQKVRFEEKLDLWLPKMTGGKKLSKAGRHGLTSFGKKATDGMLAGAPQPRRPLRGGGTGRAGLH
jgi:hypothetical protein